jgi:dTDP-4-amino-4,6-dideoxygalactose transaminase
MDGIQGAILRVKLGHLDGWTEKRREHARHYEKLLGNSGVRTTSELANRRHVYHIFSVFHPERDKLQAHLGEHGIQTGIHYPIPVHLQQAYRHLDYKAGDFPVTEQVANEQLSLPMFPELVAAEVERVAEAVRSWAG